MKEGFSELEQHNIIRAKQILKHLVKSSPLKQSQLIEALAEQGLSVKKNTLSMWLSSKDGNYNRPKSQFIEPMLRIICADTHNEEQIDEILDEVNILLGYTKGPETSEMVLNKVNQQLNNNLTSQLKINQQNLESFLSSLDWLLDEVEPKILEYDKGFPIIFVEKSEKKLLKELLGKDKSLHKEFEVVDGYEVPMTQISSLETISEILNNLNEGSRLLLAYVERHLLDEYDVLIMDFPRVEDFVAYAWEISDRLLNNNLLCKAVPILKRTLLRVMTICWGVRYILQNQTRDISEVSFQNILELKGKTSKADINSSVAVYMGILSRQLLKSPSITRAEKGLKLYKKAHKLLLENHEQLNTEQEIFYYKKELANLNYDAASLLLHHKKNLDKKQIEFKHAIKNALQYYEDILNQPNLFYEGLTEVRANSVRIFHLISFCWNTEKLEAGVREINKLSPGQQMNQDFWMLHLAKAIAYCVLHLRAQESKEKNEYKMAAQTALQTASLVPGFKDNTIKEMAADFVLKETFPEQINSFIS